MSSASSLIVSAFIVLPVFAIDDRKSLYLDPTGGMKPFVVKAAMEQELDIEFPKDDEHSVLRVFFVPKFNSLQSELLYRKNTGRTENARMEVVNTKTKKTILIFDFTWPRDDAGRQRIASEFVRKLKTKLGD